MALPEAYTARIHGVSLQSKKQKQGPTGTNDVRCCQGNRWSTFGSTPQPQSLFSYSFSFIHQWMIFAEYLAKCWFLCSSFFFCGWVWGRLQESQALFTKRQIIISCILVKGVKHRHPLDAQLHILLLVNFRCRGWLIWLIFKPAQWRINVQIRYNKINIRKCKHTMGLICISKTKANQQSNISLHWQNKSWSKET